MKKNKKIIDNFEIFLKISLARVFATGYTKGYIEGYKRGLQNAKEKERSATI